MTKKIYVHDRIVHQWWAEAILKDLIKHYWTDNAAIFTLFSKQDTFENIPVTTVFWKTLNNFFISWSSSTWKIVRRIADYRNLMPLYPLLVRLLRRKIKKQAPETLIVSSFAAVKNIVWWWLVPKQAVLYCHSPMQYIRENYKEYCMKLSWVKKRIFIASSIYLRKRDRRKNLYTTVYSNSYYTKSVIEKWYGRKNSIVRYPTIEEVFLSSPALKKPYEYYLFVWRIVTFVRELDKIIDMCNTLRLPLIIMGSGPDEIALKERAWPTITFIWHISDHNEKATIIKQAKWLINLAKESCWIGTMEALSLWVPVFWYNQWGTAELVHSSELWMLVSSKNTENLIDNLSLFHQRAFDREKIKEQFLQFYKDNTPEKTKKA